MNKNKPFTDNGWTDQDDAPDLSEAPWTERLIPVPVRRGRPRLEKPKVATTLRLDADIVTHFRTGGAGWQSRLNAALREWIATRSAG